MMNNSIKFIPNHEKISAIKVYTDKNIEKLDFEIKTDNKKITFSTNSIPEKQYPDFESAFYRLKLEETNNKCSEVLEITPISEENVRITKIKTYYKKNIFEIIEAYLKSLINTQLNLNNYLKITSLIAIIILTILICKKSILLIKNQD